MKTIYLLWSVVLVLLLLPIGGCWEELALVGGGAVGGLSWERFITQAQEDVEENIQLLEDDNERLKAELTSTTDEAKRAELQAKIKNNLKMLDDLGVAKLSLQRAREGLGVDWQNPEAATIFILGAVTTFLQYRKKKQLGTALSEVVAGGQSFKKSGAHDLANFKAAHNNAQSLDTKKIVATMKAS